MIIEINTGISRKNRSLANAKVIAGTRSRAAPRNVSPGRCTIPNAPIAKIDIPRKHVVNMASVTDLPDIIGLREVGRSSVGSVRPFILRLPR